MFSCVVAQLLIQMLKYKFDKLVMLFIYFNLEESIAHFILQEII